MGPEGPRQDQLAEMVLVAAVYFDVGNVAGSDVDPRTSLFVSVACSIVTHASSPVLWRAVGAVDTDAGHVLAGAKIARGPEVSSPLTLPVGPGAAVKGRASKSGAADGE